VTAVSKPPSQRSPRRGDHLADWRRTGWSARTHDRSKRRFRKRVNRRYGRSHPQPACSIGHRACSRPGHCPIGAARYTTAHDGALAVRQIPIRRGPGWEQPGRTRRDARGNSGAAEHVRPNRNGDDCWHPARIPAADRAECGPERAASGLADRSTSLTARPRPGPGLRTVRGGPRFGCRRIMCAETSPRIRRAGQCSGQPGSRPTALTSGNALPPRLGDGVAHRCRDSGHSTSETVCDLRFCAVAGVGFEPT